jgi:hypothetical protein
MAIVAILLETFCGVIEIGIMLKFPPILFDIITTEGKFKQRGGISWNFLTVLKFRG